MTVPAGILALRHEERLEQSETLFFTMRGDSPKADLILEDIELGWRGRRFYVYEVLRRRDAGAILLDVEAPALWNRLAERRFVGTFKLYGVTTAAGLETILTATDWTVGTIADSIATDPTTWYMEHTDGSYLELLRKWAKVTGLELQFDTEARTVSLVTELGVDRGVGFRYGRNVLSVERRSTPPLCTRLYAYGANNLTIAGQTGTGLPYLDDFTYYTDQGLTLAEAEARYTRELVWKDDAFTVDTALFAAAETKLAELAAGQVAYTLDVVDLSQLTGLAEDTFHVGDRVRVSDPGIGSDVNARVVRLVRTPLDPSGGEVELSTLDTVVPDPSVSDSRDSPFEWELFADLDTSVERRVTSASTILGRLDLTTTPGAEWVYGYSFYGVGVGTGSISATAYDSSSGELLHPVIVKPVADGVPFELAFTAGEKELAGRERSLVVRAQSSGSSVEARTTTRGSAFWVLARGTTQREVTLPEVQRFTYTGAVQTFTVPDDVTTVTIEAVGAVGGGGSTAGKGGRVAATFDVVAGTVYDVYVGGAGTDSLGAGGGWPNGGDGGFNSSSGTGYGGGGASYVLPTGGAFTAALVVAGGGGGINRSGASRLHAQARGGDAGFYAGTAGYGRDLGVGEGGGGATQTAAGAAGTDTAGGSAGDTPSQGFGADAVDSGSAFDFNGGGGGGGWHGGGSVGAPAGFGGGSYAGDGGGGSGYLAPGAYAIDYTDATNTTDGYIEFQWETPV